MAPHLTAKANTLTYQALCDLLFSISVTQFILLLLSLPNCVFLFLEHCQHSDTTGPLHLLVTCLKSSFLKYPNVLLLHLLQIGPQISKAISEDPTLPCFISPSL